MALYTDYIFSNAKLPKSETENTGGFCPLEKAHEIAIAWIQSGERISPYEDLLVAYFNILNDMLKREFSNDSDGED